MANTRTTYPAPGSGTKPQFFVDGVEVSEDEYDKSLALESRLDEMLAHMAGPDGHRPACWPMPGSNSQMVHPKQLKQMQQKLASAGVPTDFDQHCRPIFRDRKHRKDYCAVERVVDRRGGYGDRT